MLCSWFSLKKKKQQTNLKAVKTQFFVEMENWEKGRNSFSFKNAIDICNCHWKLKALSIRIFFFFLSFLFIYAFFGYCFWICLYKAVNCDLSTNISPGLNYVLYYAARLINLVVLCKCSLTVAFWASSHMVVLKLWTESQTFQVRVLGKADRVPALAAVDSARLALPGIIQISRAQDGQAHVFFPHPSSQPHVCKNALFRRNSFPKYLPLWPPKIDSPAYYVLPTTQTPSVLLWPLRISGLEATTAPVACNISEAVWCPSMQRILKK